MTNEKWLNTLSTEEKAKFLVRSCNFCSRGCVDKYRSENVCENGVKEWLQKKHIDPMPKLQIGDVLTSITNRTFIVVHKDYVYDVSDERIASLNWVLGVYTNVDVSRVDINGKCQSIWRADNGKE